MKSLLFKRIFQARKKRIMVYNKIRKVWEQKPSLCEGFNKLIIPVNYLVVFSIVLSP